MGILFAAHAYMVGRSVADALSLTVYDAFGTFF